MAKKRINKKKPRGRKKVRKNLTLSFYWKIYRILKDYYDGQGYAVDVKQLRIYAADIRKYIDVKVDAKERGRKLELKFFKEIVLGGDKYFKQRQDLFDELDLPFPEKQIEEEFYYFELEEKAIKIPRNIYFLIDFGIINEPDSFWEGIRGDIPYSDIINRINDYVRYGGARAEYYVFVATEIDAEQKIIILTLEEKFAGLLPEDLPIDLVAPPEKEKIDEKPKDEEQQEPVKKPQKEADEKIRKAKAEADDAELRKLYGSLEGKRAEQKSLLEIMIMKKKAKMNFSSEEKEIAELEKQIEKIKSKIAEIEG
jgi:hypothetical protein